MQSAARRFILTLSCLMLLCLHAEGQQEVDSLLQALQTSSKGEAVNINIELCYAYGESGDEQRALTHAKLAYSLAKELNDTLNIIKSGRLIGRSYKLFNKLDSSIYILTYILSIAKGSRFELEYGQLLNSLGSTYTFKASYAEAMKCHFESLSVMEKLDNKQWISISLFNIGLLYYKIEDHGKALEYFRRAYQLKQTIDYYTDVEILLIDIGLCYNNLGNFKKAEEYVKLALDACKTNCTDGIKVQAEYAFGAVAFRQEKIALAESHFLQSYDLAKAINNKRFQFDNIVNLSGIYQKSNQFQKAEKYLIEGEKLVAEASCDLEIIKLYKQFFTLYEKIGDLKKMILYQEKYIHLKDSVYNENYTNSLMRVQANYLERENKARIAYQEQLLGLKDAVIVRQNWLNILAGMAGILLILMVYVLYMSNKQRKITNQLLDRKVAERTKELELSHEQLQKRLEEEDLTIEKTMADIKSAVATMKGLNSLALKQSIDSRDQEQVILLNVVIDQLVEILRKK